MNGLFNKTFNVLSAMLDYRAERHKIVVSNIANIDTTDFKPSELTFKNEFSKAHELAMTTTDPGHIARRKESVHSIEYEIKTSEEKVNLDTEMTNLAENHLMYNTTVEMLARKFRGLNTVLKEAK
jgi:flagellar basal-body rod protein FlgB